MIWKSRARVGAVAGLLSGIPKLPQVLRTSLQPETEIEARIVDGQLDMVRTSLKLLTTMLPLAGAVIFLLDQFHSKIVLGTWWVALISTCIGSEMFLDRAAPPATLDIIPRTRIRARQRAAVCFILTAVWSSVVIFLWTPSFPINQMFVELILCCTLAALTSIASLHAASVAGPICLVSAAVILVPVIKDVQLHPTLLGLAIIYVMLMVWHACTLQIASVRMLRLEIERSDLIENLRKAKLESDLAHERAVAAARAKSEFLANMSHELRTPLNAIIGFSDIVRSRTFGNSLDKYAEYGGFIHQSGHHLLNMLGDILDLAKMEAGRKVLTYEPIGLSGVIADEVAKVSEKAQAKTIEIVQAVPRALPLLSADQLALRQILSNLLSNAVKFTPQDGRIEVSVALDAEDRIALSVSDTGVGIAPEDQGHIFDLFGHANPKVTAAHRGSGLGLAIVKGLVTMHGGHIRLKSALGEGTSITIVFPAQSTLQQGNSRAA